MRQILCYGDSNTWGLIPGVNQRYAWEQRWTGILQEKLNNKDIRVIEEGLCGRTTIFDDLYRDNRNGLKALPLILESNSPIDFVIIMLGTNDCKAHYKATPYRIAKGLEQCVEKIAEFVPLNKILIVSPIHLGDRVWEKEFDPEFDENSVKVSKELKKEYGELADRIGVHFLAASDYAFPSNKDREHMDIIGHKELAEAIYRKLQEISLSTNKV